MRMRLTNRSTVFPFSTDIESSDGEMIRLLVPPGGSIDTPNVDPFYLNQDKILRSAVFEAAALDVLFLPEADDLVGFPWDFRFLTFKTAARVATTANLASLSGLGPVDGVVLMAGNRVLVKNQTTPPQNGIYVAAAGSWTRADDADTGAKLRAGSLVFATEGTQADTAWLLTTNDPITIGTTALVWSQFGTGGSGGRYDQIQEEGANLTQRTTLDVVGEALTASDTGTKTQLLVASYGLTGVVSQIDAGDVASGGALNQLARADHQHAVSTAVVGDLAVADAAAAAAGTGTSIPRADHKHQVSTAAPSVTVKSEATAAAVGAAATVLRTDAQIQALTAAPVSVGLANALGAASGLARADHVHADVFPPLLWGNNSVAATVVTRFLTPGYTSSLAQTTTIQIRVPRPGTLRNLRVRHNGTAGNGNAIVYTVRVNGVASVITVSLASTATDASDLVNTAAVASGDLLDIQVTKALGVGTSPADIAATLELTT